MYAVPHYYHRSENAYGERKVLVKQEPIDLFEAGTPMDITAADTECQPSASLDVPSDHRSISCENVHFQPKYVPGHHRFAEHRKTHTFAKEHVAYAQHPSLEDLSRITPLPSTDVDDFHTNFTRINLVPEILTKTGNNFNLDTADLSIIAANQRARREFVPENKKDNSYWCKRLKNNDSARRSRVKRKALEKILETRLLELKKENLELKHELASLRRRYGEDNVSSSDLFSSLPDHTSLNTALPSSLQDNVKTEVVARDFGSEVFCSSDNSPQTSGTFNIKTTINPKLGILRTDTIDNNSQVKTLSNSQTNSSSFNDDITINERQTDITGALDLTIDNSNRSTPTWESSSSESDNNCCLKRYNFMSSESSSLEDNNNTRSIKVFPLKCRWKKEMHSTYMTVPERLK